MASIKHFSPSEFLLPLVIAENIVERFAKAIEDVTAVNTTKIAIRIMLKLETSSMHYSLQNGTTCVYPRKNFDGTSHRLYAKIKNYQVFSI